MHIYLYFFKLLQFVKIFIEEIEMDIFLKISFVLIPIIAIGGLYAGWATIACFSPQSCHSNPILIDPFPGIALLIVIFGVPASVLSFVVGLIITIKEKFKNK